MTDLEIINRDTEIINTQAGAGKQLTGESWEKNVPDLRLGLVKKL